MKREKYRDSKFELLRIISMFFVILCHFGHHGFNLEKIGYVSNKLIIDIFSMGGKIGTNLFIFITAWFMVDSKIKIKRILKIYGEIVFYSIGILLLFSFILVPVEKIGITDAIREIFPISMSEYWFMSAYIILMLLTPLLNSIICNIERNKVKNFIFLALFISCLFSGNFHIQNCFENDIIWFATIYLLIGYIKRYNVINNNNWQSNLIFAIIFYILLLLTSICINLIGHYFNDNNRILSHSTWFMNQNSIFVFLTSIEVFITFIKIPSFYNKFINVIASCVLGIYLIHDNLIMRPFLWQKVIKTNNFIYSPYLILIGFATTILIFSVCVIIDLIRQKSIEKIFLKIIDKYITNDLENKNKILYNTIIQRLMKVFK